jgi:PAS domain S-box-containing protein
MDSLSEPWLRLSRRHLPVIALVCLGVCISALTFEVLHSLEQDKAKAAFQRVAQERFDALQADIDLAVSKVVAVGAFCESDYPVTRRSFDHFVIPLFSGRDPGIQALEWVPRVTRSQRLKFEKSARDGGLPGFEIQDHSDQGKMIRAGDRDVYFPVLYVQPAIGNQIVNGYDDLPANARRRETLASAVAAGELSASARVTLIQESVDQYGIVLFRPVYRDIDGTSDKNKRELLGFAEGVLRVDSLVEQHGANSGIDLSVTDLSAGEAEQHLYPTRRQSSPLSSFTLYRTISVANRTWKVAASPVPGAFPVSKNYSYAGSALSLLITLLIAAYIHNTLGRHIQIERVVEERTGALNTALASLAEVHRGLAQSEGRYRRLIEDSPNAIVVEREGKIVMVNRTAEELFGFNAALDPSAHALAEFVVPERRKLAEELIQDLYARESQSPTRETQVIRGNGSIVDVEVAASSFFHEGARSIQVVMRDISGRKQGLAENARLLRALEQVSESIVVTDPDANIVHVNPAFERITGYSRDEVLGKNPRLLSSGRQSKEFYTALWDSLKSGGGWSGRFVNRTKSGRLFTEEATISPIVDSTGQIINYVAVKRDVTLETELQEKLHQSQKMDAIGRLAGGVAHDFNNMLMVIVSYTELLGDSLPEDDPLRKYTEHIMLAAQRSSALTRQLLAFSRKQVLAPQILDCNTIVLETSSMVRRLISENIDLKCELAPNLWRVKADSDQMVQVILNLCVNSRDAMPNGGSLVLATRNYSVDQGFVELSVTDTGVGIPLESQEKLFEPFFTTKERGKGTGLGLATVYGIVQQSGGYIRLDSAPGKGAKFRIFLPRCQDAAPSLEGSTPKNCTQGCSVVLVVEDEPALREAIAHYLRNHGYQVFAAANGKEALDVLDRTPNISILVSDLIMPQMGGRELVRLAAKKNPNLHILFMSGYADQAFSDEDETACPTAFLQKPFSMNLLLTRITEVAHR